MSHEEAVSFIKGAITGEAIQYWADLGCGTGTFTRALVALLPVGSHVTAVDRELQNLKMEEIDFVQANFEGDELELSDLDGVLIANALHYVLDKKALIKKLEPMFGGGPRFIIIEYDTERSNNWVPYPITFQKLKDLFAGLGYRRIVKLKERRSAYGAGNMYCTLIEKVTL